MGLKCLFQVISPSELGHPGFIIGSVDETGGFGVRGCLRPCLLLVNSRRPRRHQPSIQPPCSPLGSSRQGAWSQGLFSEDLGLPSSRLTPDHIVCLCVFTIAVFLVPGRGSGRGSTHLLKELFNSESLRKSERCYVATGSCLPLDVLTPVLFACVVFP